MQYFKIYIKTREYHENSLFCAWENKSVTSEGKLAQTSNWNAIK